MKILLFLNNDIHSATILEKLLPSLKKHQVEIILSKAVGKNTNLCPELLEMKKAEEYSKNWEKEFGFKVKSYQNINSPEAIEDIKETSPDLFISMRFGQIFQQEIINLPKFGAINLHSGIMPKYRGIMSTFWAISKGEKEIGMTLHYITNGEIDKGKIIKFYKTKVDFSSTLFVNINNLYKNAFYLVEDAIKEISRNQKLETISDINWQEKMYFSYPKKDEVEKFISNKMPLF